MTNHTSSAEALGEYVALQGWRPDLTSTLDPDCPYVQRPGKAGEPYRKVSPDYQAPFLGTTTHRADFVDHPYSKRQPL
jgi:hypothetical protein